MQFHISLISLKDIHKVKGEWQVMYKHNYINRRISMLFISKRCTNRNKEKIMSKRTLYRKVRLWQLNMKMDQSMRVRYKTISEMDMENLLTKIHLTILAPDIKAKCLGKVNYSTLITSLHIKATFSITPSMDMVSSSTSIQKSLTDPLTLGISIS